MSSEARHETGWVTVPPQLTLPVLRDHPTPLALRAIDPAPPGEGKIYARGFAAVTTPFCRRR